MPRTPKAAKTSNHFPKSSRSRARVQVHATPKVELTSYSFAGPGSPVNQGFQPFNGPNTSGLSTPVGVPSPVPAANSPEVDFKSQLDMIDFNRLEVSKRHEQFYMSLSAFQTTRPTANNFIPLVEALSQAARNLVEARAALIHVLGNI